MTNSRDSEKSSSAPMSNVFREASATGAASGRGILAHVGALFVLLTFALLAFAHLSNATESELVPAAPPTDGKIVEVIIGNFTFAPKDLTIAPGKRLNGSTMKTSRIWLPRRPSALSRRRHKTRRLLRTSSQPRSGARALAAISRRRPSETRSRQYPMKASGCYNVKMEVIG